MSNDFITYLKAEHGFEEKAFKEYKDELSLCINIWNFLHTGLLNSVDRNAFVLMNFKVQVDNSIFSAITSLIRLHGVQYHQCLRYALENMAICLYGLVHLPDFNEIILNSKETEFAEKIKKKGYKLLETKYPTINVIFNRLKELTNTYGAHASFESTIANIEFKTGDLQKLNTNLFDSENIFLIRTRLLISVDLIIGFIDMLINARMDEKMLPLKDNAKETVEKFRDHFLTLKKKLDSERITLNKKAGRNRNKPCWCGSGLKFKKCHWKFDW